MANEIVYDETYLKSLEELDTPDAGEAFDPDASYNRPAPPIEDGWYQMKFSNAGVYSDGNKVPYRSAQWKNEHKPHFEIAVMGEIIAPDDLMVNEKRVWTGMPLTTTPDPDRGNASAVGAAFRALTGKPIAGLPGLSHCKQLDEVLKSSPIAWGRVQNQLRDVDAEKAAAEAGEKRPKSINGQKRIMALPGGTNAQGKFSGAADHPETGTRCASKAVLVEFKGADFTPPVKK
jgi:hypothetical protein